MQFYSENSVKAGVLTDKGVLPLKSLSADMPETVLDLIKCDDDVMARIPRLVESAPADAYIPTAQIRYAAPVTGMEKVLCIGLNYRRHAMELGLKLPAYPTVFCKLANAYAAHQEEIPFPAEASHVDYEAELVIIMGNGGKIWGYTCGNDLSIREWQNETTQWIVGKNADGFAPMGPCVVDAASLNGDDLHIESRVNGEVRQSSTTSDMIFNCQQIIDYIQPRVPLKAGDAIFTGTPSGVMQGYPKDQQHWLVPGDTIEVEIENIGVLSNCFAK